MTAAHANIEDQINKYRTLSGRRRSLLGTLFFSAIKVTKQPHIGCKMIGIRLVGGDAAPLRLLGLWPPDESSHRERSLMVAF